MPDWSWAETALTLGLVREQEAGLQAFLSHDGFSVLMRGMQSEHEKLRTKSAFLLLNLLTSHPEHKGKLWGDAMANHSLQSEATSTIQRRLNVNVSFFSLTVNKVCSEYSSNSLSQAASLLEKYILFQWRDHIHCRICVSCARSDSLICVEQAFPFLTATVVSMGMVQQLVSVLRTPHSQFHEHVVGTLCWQVF